MTDNDDTVYIPTLIIEERQNANHISRTKAKAELLEEYSDPTETLFAFAYQFSEKEIADSKNRLSAALWKIRIGWKRRFYS